MRQVAAYMTPAYFTHCWKRRQMKKDSDIGRISMQVIEMSVSMVIPAIYQYSSISLVVTPGPNTRQLKREISALSSSKGLPLLSCQ